MTKMNRGEWDGKCSKCGVQIHGNSNEELHYDLEEYGSPAYCKNCWDRKEKERMHDALKDPILWIIIICFILLILWKWI